jgi:Ca2+-binding EF-hand superfamily protein
MDFPSFVDLVKKDRLLTPELPKWNEECSDVAEELFQHLDRNKDGSLTDEDLQQLENADLKLWAGNSLKNLVRQLFS